MLWQDVYGWMIATDPMPKVNIILSIPQGAKLHRRKTMYESFTIEIASEAHNVRLIENSSGSDMFRQVVTDAAATQFG